MGADYHARQIYDMQIRDVTTSEDKWKSILKLAGNLYRYEFDNILLIYAQRPQATLVADYDTWKKVDRYVMRGSKGIAIFPSRALNPHLRYVFDIKDTGGRKRNLTWDLNGNTLKEYVDYLSLEGDVEPDWVNLDTDPNGIRMNSYFVQHPEMILGEMVMESTRFGMDSVCKADENADLAVPLERL